MVTIRGGGFFKMITVLHLRDGLGHGQPTLRRMKCRVKLPAQLLSARTKIIKTCFLANFDQSPIDPVRLGNKVSESRKTVSSYCEKGGNYRQKEVHLGQKYIYALKVL